MKKLAVLRDDSNLPCPFGLSIPIACKRAGNSVLSMNIITDQSSQDKIDENLKIFNEINDFEPCLYANKILKKNVICELDEDDESENMMPVGSPLYFKPLSGASFFGTYMSPAGYYNDNSIDRSYQTLYSIENIAAEDPDEIIKLANDFFNLIIRV